MSRKIPKPRGARLFFCRRTQPERWSYRVVVYIDRAAIDLRLPLDLIGLRGGRMNLNYTPYFRDTTFNPDQRRSFALRDYLTVFGEYTVSNSLTVRMEYTVWDDFRISRENWSDRVLQTLAYTEEERIDPRNFLQLRVRKTF